ncbi:glutathione S-transferase U17-like [Sesamum indicum]|uniref:glutathione transferase n=1 Tax=Sesamum indicum TaxID=4182 RepID=A0A6I9TM82_SESIN|nr:glutathione S-transferase U17-like [Sesamum indicum]
MATSNVKVLGAWPSPFVNRVRMALKVKSVDYELIETNPHEKTELLIKSNPVHKKIPVLFHGDKRICESLIIVQYIDEVWTDGPSILPSDPYDRAIARFWAAYIDDKWFPLFQLLRDAQGEERKAVVEKISGGLLLLEGAFVDCSKGKAFFGGDNVGYLDIALAGCVGWMRASDILLGAKFLDETKTPHLVGWVGKLYSDSSVKDLMPDPHILIELYKKFQAMSEAASE